MKKAFVDFVNRVPFYGRAILCIDHPTVQSLLPEVEKRVATYGESHQADYRAEGIAVSGHAVRFNAWRRDEPLGPFEVAMVGRHNALNALAVIALGDEMGIPADVTRRALASFQGVQRRFTVRGEAGGVTVVDDYGHHPTEIKATLSAAKRGWERRTVVIFQPHRYTRTRDLFKEFLTAFNQADVLFLAGIYAASEDPIPGVRIEDLYEGIKGYGHKDVTLVPEKDRIADAVLPRLQPGDMVFTLGAGDIWKIGEKLIARLSEFPEKK